MKRLLKTICFLKKTHFRKIGIQSGFCEAGTSWVSWRQSHIDAWLSNRPLEQAGRRQVSAKRSLRFQDCYMFQGLGLVGLGKGEMQS